MNWINIWAMFEVIGIIVSLFIIVIFFLYIGICALINKIKSKKRGDDNE